MNELSLRDFELFRKFVEEKRSEMDRSAGVLVELKRRLKEELDVDTRKEAQDLLKQEQANLTKIKAKYDHLFKECKQQYEGKL